MLTADFTNLLQLVKIMSSCSLVVDYAYRGTRFKVVFAVKGRVAIYSYGIYRIIPVPKQSGFVKVIGTYIVKSLVLKATYHSIDILAFILLV